MQKYTLLVPVCLISNVVQMSQKRHPNLGKLVRITSQSEFDLEVPDPPDMAAFHLLPEIKKVFALQSDTRYLTPLEGARIDKKTTVPVNRSASVFLHPLPPSPLFFCLAFIHQHLTFTEEHLFGQYLFSLNQRFHPSFFFNIIPFSGLERNC